MTYEEAQVGPAQGPGGSVVSSRYYATAERPDALQSVLADAPVIEKVAVRVQVVRFAQLVIDERDDRFEVRLALVCPVRYRSIVASQWSAFAR